MCVYHRAVDAQPANHDRATQPNTGQGAANVAADELIHLVYDQLRKAAQLELASERPGHTLSATALVHEAFAQLQAAGPAWENRGHFYAAAVTAMRRILIDHARARAAAKRGGERKRDLSALGLDAVAVTLGADPAMLLEVDEAIAALEVDEPAKAQLVRLRFFAGLTLEQAGRALGLSPATADRHWAYARAWLFECLSKA